jgi:hypothetical protein
LNQWWNFTTAKYVQTGSENGATKMKSIVVKEMFLSNYIFLEWCYFACSSHWFLPTQHFTRYQFKSFKIYKCLMQACRCNKRKKNNPLFSSTYIE